MMDEKMKKLMEKHAGKEISPMHKEAKMSMLKALRDEMSGMMKDSMQKPGLKKVEVAASDKAGLADGLDKAKDMLGSDSAEADMPEHEEDSDSHGIDSPDMWDVDKGMEDDAESGEPHEEESELSPDEEAHMHKLMARHVKHSRK